MMKLSARRVPRECFEFWMFLNVLYDFGYLACRGHQCYYFQMSWLVMQRNFPFPNKQAYCLSFSKMFTRQGITLVKINGAELKLKGRTMNIK